MSWVGGGGLCVCVWGGGCVCQGNSGLCVCGGGGRCVCRKLCDHVGRVSRRNGKAVVAE